MFFLFRFVSILSVFDPMPSPLDTMNNALGLLGEDRLEEGDFEDAPQWKNDAIHVASLHNEDHRYIETLIQSIVDVNVNALQIRFEQATDQTEKDTYLAQIAEQMQQVENMRHLSRRFRSVANVLNAAVRHNKEDFAKFILANVHDVYQTESTTVRRIEESVNTMLLNIPTPERNAAANLNNSQANADLTTDSDVPNLENGNQEFFQGFQ